MGNNTQKPRPAPAESRPVIAPPGRVLSTVAHGPAAPVEVAGAVIDRFRTVLGLSADVPAPRVFDEAIARLGQAK